MNGMDDEYLNERTVCPSSVSLSGKGRHVIGRNSHRETDRPPPPGLARSSLTVCGVSILCIIIKVMLNVMLNNVYGMCTLNVMFKCK